MAPITCDQVVAKLKALSDRKDIEGMARFGINPDKALRSILIFWMP